MLERRTPLRRTTRLRSKRPGPPRRQAARCVWQFEGKVHVHTCKKRPKPSGLCDGHETEVLDGVMRCIVRERDKWTCQVNDGEPHAGVVQVMHLWPKGTYTALRWLLWNVKLGCARHHRRYTNDWPRWMQVCRDWLGSDFEVCRIYAVETRLQPKYEDAMRYLLSEADRMGIAVTVPATYLAKVER